MAYPLLERCERHLYRNTRTFPIISKRSRTHTELFAMHTAYSMSDADMSAT